jgi:protein ImuB
MRLLFLDWPHLRIRLALGREPGPEELVVLGGRPWDPGSVLDHSPAAGRLGVRRGQPLGTAHDLVPDATFLPAQPDADGAAFEAALEALAGLSPSVEGEADPTAPSFGRVLVGIEGLARLWGDEPAIVARAVRLLAPILPGRPRCGIGNTRFGARVAAVTGAGVTDAAEPVGAGPPLAPLAVIPAGGPREEAAFLAPLPVSLLPADPGTRERLRVLGLARIGDLAALDRSAVIARFGAAGAGLHDLARGLDGRPLRPRRPLERLAAEVELDPPVDTLEPLRFVLRHLCGALCAQLSARGAGAGRATLALTLSLAGGPSARDYDQALPEPAAAADLLERLLMARLEASPPGAPVERLGVALDAVAPLAGQQLMLFTPQAARTGRLEWQLASLALRFGPDRVLRAEPADPEAPLAERRFTWRRAVDP